jgi:hypothetical protein
MNGQLLVPATLSPGNSPVKSLDRNWEGLKAYLDIMELRKIGTLQGIGPISFSQ